MTVLVLKDHAYMVIGISLLVLSDDVESINPIGTHFVLQSHSSHRPLELVHEYTAVDIYILLHMMLKSTSTILLLLGHTLNVAGAAGAGAVVSESERHQTIEEPLANYIALHGPPKDALKWDTDKEAKPEPDKGIVKGRIHTTLLVMQFARR